MKSLFLLVYLTVSPVDGTTTKVTFPAAFKTKAVCESVITVFEEHKLYTDQPMVCVKE